MTTLMGFESSFEISQCSAISPQICASCALRDRMHTLAQLARFAQNYAVLVSEIVRKKEFFSRELIEKAHRTPLQPLATFEDHSPRCGVDADASVGDSLNYFWRLDRRFSCDFTASLACQTNAYIKIRRRLTRQDAHRLRINGAHIRAS